MLVVISGTNRPQSNSSRVARLCQRRLEALGQEVEVLDLVVQQPVQAGHVFGRQVALPAQLLGQGGQLGIGARLGAHIR